jgi:hypothetical protein
MGQRDTAKVSKLSLNTEQLAEPWFRDMTVCTFGSTSEEWDGIEAWVRLSTGVAVAGVTFTSEAVKAK